MKRLLVLALLIAAVSPPAAAQIIPLYEVMYRPPGVVYEVLKTRHFDVIFQREAESDARRLASILERTLVGTQQILPVSPGFRMPVVVNRLSDRGNGYVRTVPFRQEIESGALKGRNLSPRHTSWLDTVGPHELVHAVHADFRTGVGLGWLLRPFAPDVSRSINLWTPPGVAEGAAVHYESSLEEGAGRLHHAYFTAPFRAAAATGNTWSLAQALEAPSYTRPSDRYYIGGSRFFEWLVETRGRESFRRTSSVHNRFPLLGYGFSLWVGTRTAPWVLGREFRRASEDAEARRLASLGSLTPVRIIAGSSGTIHRRPRWLIDGTIVAYRTAYDRRRGLYRFDSRTGRSTAITYQDLADDFFLSVAPDGRSLLFARDHPDAWAPIRSVADLHRVDLTTGDTERLSTGKHLLAPVLAPDGGIWAVRVEGSDGAWVRFSPPSGRLESIHGRPGERVLSVEPDGRGRYAALVINRSGDQSLYLASRRVSGSYEVEAAVRFVDGSVYDATWTPDGRWIVFTADAGGVMNVWAHDPDAGRTVQVTHVPFGAMEPTVSPDGERVAFVLLGEDRSDLAEASFRPETLPPADPELFAGSGERAIVLETPGNGSDGEHAQTATVTSYRAWRYLSPRALYPILYAPTSTLARPHASLGWGTAVAAQGVDPLQRWAWWGEGIFREGHLWGEIGVATGRSVLRPILRLYDRPSLVTVWSSGGTGLRRVREERGLEAAIHVPVLISSNVYTTSAAFGVGLQLEDERLLDADMRSVTSWDRHLTLTPFTSAGIGMQRNLRDLIPNSGISMGVSSEVDLVRPAGALRRAVSASAAVFVPLLSRWNGGVRISAGWIAQNRQNVLDLDLFMPRGHEDIALAHGWAVKTGLDLVMPVVFVDNGSILIPVFLQAVYLYGFAERLLDGGMTSQASTAAGGGIGLQLRLLHILPLDLRIGFARRLEHRDWVTVYR